MNLNSLFNLISKKAQVSLFVIVAGVLLLSASFIIVSSNSTEQNEIKQGQVITNQVKIDSVMIVESGQKCLERGMEKALIISSMRGGLIYSNTDFFQFSGNRNISGILNDEYLINLNLDINALTSSIYPGASDQIYISKLSTQNISEELNHYITRDFIQCQMNQFEFGPEIELSYSVLNLSSIDNVHSTNFSYEVKNMIGDINDTVSFYRNDGSINKGKIYYSDNESILIESEISFPLDETILVIHDDFYSIKSEIKSNEITSSISTSDSYSFDTSKLDNTILTYSINTPFYSLMQEMESILNSKVFNRSINFSNSNHLDDLNLRENLELSIIYLVNQSDNITQILQLKDTSSSHKFPYFVSLYKNTNPILDEDIFRVGSSGVVDLSSNPVFLQGKLSHLESEDVILHNYKFIPYSDPLVSLSETGQLTTTASSGVFSRVFYVTDQELKTSFSVDFDLGGVTENTDNSFVDNCFDITYTLNGISERYDEFNLGSGANREVRLMSRVGGDGNYQWLGLVSAKDSSMLVTIDRNSNCFNGNETFSGIPSLPHTFPLSKDGSVDFSISVSGVADSYNFTIAGTDCLGPYKVSRDGGYGSCCDVDRIENLKSSGSFTALQNEEFILPNGEIGLVFNQAFLCVEGPIASIEEDWNPITAILKTAQLPTKLRAVCQGDSALLNETQIETEGTNSIGLYTHIPSLFSVELKVNLSTSGMYPICQECRQDTVNGFIFDDPLAPSSRDIITLNPTILSQNANDGILIGTTYDVEESAGFEDTRITGYVQVPSVDADGNPILDADGNQVYEDGAPIYDTFPQCKDVEYQNQCVSGSEVPVATGVESAPYDC